jgi:hypothetical protein
VTPNYADISGTISGILPDGRYVWIVVNPRDAYGDWYPQGKDHLSIGSEKDWGMQVRIGREGREDISKYYEIRAILVDKATDELFREWAKGQDYDDPLELPDNAITLDQITVKRVDNSNL